jgi:hypothetical protein
MTTARSVFNLHIERADDKMAGAADCRMPPTKYTTGWPRRSAAAARSSEVQIVRLLFSRSSVSQTDLREHRGNDEWRI